MCNPHHRLTPEYLKPHAPFFGFLKLLIYFLWICLFWVFHINAIVNTESSLENVPRALEKTLCSAVVQGVVDTSPRFSWFPVSFKSSVLWLVICLVILSIIKSGVMKFQTVVIRLSVSPFCGFFLCLFWVSFLGVYVFIIVMASRRMKPFIILCLCLYLCCSLSQECPRNIFSSVLYWSCTHSPRHIHAVYSEVVLSLLVLLTPAFMYLYPCYGICVFVFLLLIQETVVPLYPLHTHDGRCLINIS